MLVALYLAINIIRDIFNWFRF